MNTKLTLSVVAALVVLAVGAVVPAAAAGAAGPQPTVAQQAAPNNSTTAPSAPAGEQIDADVRLVSSSYDASSGTATLVLESDGATAVTLSDAGGFIDGGEINRRTVVLNDGQTTIEFAVTETNRGYVGVSIATENVLYAEVIESPSISPFRGSSGTVGWFGGAAIVVLSFLGAALWKLYKEGGEPVEASA